MSARREPKSTVEIGQDGRCLCTCATVCPLGRAGMELRCTEADLRSKGILVTKATERPTALTRERITEYLCIYDERNPNNVLDTLDPDEQESIVRSECACDNCFYSRRPLAEELLRVLDILNSIQERIERIYP